MTKLDLGPIGIATEIGSDASHLDEAAALEQLGYRTLWLPGGQIVRLSVVGDLIRATTTARVASCIVSPDVHDSDEVARLYDDLESTAPGRFVLGLGGSQRRPYLRDLHAYLDRLDAAAVPAERRILAALGPRKLEVARERCAGAVTLLVTPQYTSDAREILGEHATLVVDQMVVLDTDADRARGLARGRLEFLAGVAGYRTNFIRMGFTDDDIAVLSDRLVSELVVWGDVDTIAARVEAHRRAGADHVIHTILTEDRARRIDAAGQLAAL